MLSKDYRAVRDPIMSQAEIIAELPKLSFDERQKILECLCDLQNRDLINGSGPSHDLKELLDDELKEYHRDGGAGQPWSEVLAELRAKAPR